MAREPQRAPDSRHQLDSATFYKDVRSVGERLRDLAIDPMWSGAALFFLAGLAFIFPSVADVLLLALVGVFVYSRAIVKDAGLPVRVPMSYGGADPSDVDKRGRPVPADGIIFLGNERRTRREIWVSNSDARTHMLVFGTTGSGKTEMLLSLVTNALVESSGFIYIDGKADSSLFGKIYSLCRMFGREDDLLVINWMTGARDIRGPQHDKLSNTMNPFSNGSSGMIQQLIVGLISKTGEGGDMWQGRAISFVEGLVKPLVYLRDEYNIPLDAHSMTEYFDLQALERLVYEFPSQYDHDEELRRVMGGLLNYLFTLPGYDRRKSPSYANNSWLLAEDRKKGVDSARKPPQAVGQSAETLEQHGFITMQLTRIFNSMAYTYGHILKNPLGEVDLYDVIVNRRILVVLLPALEKSEPELANLGKIIVASIKQMMASGLGSKIEGRWKDVIDSKPTNSASPFILVMDEYGYYAVQGFAVVAAQARSLGFSAVFAGQDVPSFQKAGKEEAESIFANTKFKFCGALEDAKQTAELFNQAAGEAHITRIGGFHREADSVGAGTAANREISIERVHRISALDLREQGPGEFHILWRSKIIRADAFHANPKPVEYIRPNHFLPVFAPDSESLQRLNATDKLIRDVLTGESEKTHAVECAGVLTAADVPSRILPKLVGYDRLEAAAVAIVEYERTSSQLEAAASEGAAGKDESDDEGYSDVAAQEIEERHGMRRVLQGIGGTPEELARRTAEGLIDEESVVQEIGPPDAVTIFTSETQEFADRVVGAEEGGLAALRRDRDAIQREDAALALDLRATRDGVEQLEIAHGVPAEIAREHAASTIKDLENATRYPQHKQKDAEPADFKASLAALNRLLDERRREHGE
jgi:intracellular multiplication protein IcmO